MTAIEGLVESEQRKKRRSKMKDLPTICSATALFLLLALCLTLTSCAGSKKGFRSQLKPTISVFPLMGWHNRVLRELDHFIFVLRFGGFS
jgi:hypothetical protein